MFSLVYLSFGQTNNNLEGSEQLSQRKEELMSPSRVLIEHNLKQIQ
jgi:hypothetical protein